MAQESKKISFGFSKITKKPALKPQTDGKDEKEYIKCIDDKAIKLINETKVINGPFVIPLVENNNSWKDKLIEKLNSKSNSVSVKDVSNSVKTSSKNNLNSTSVSSSSKNSTVSSSSSKNSPSENFNSAPESSNNSISGSGDLNLTAASFNKNLTAPSSSENLTVSSSPKDSLSLPNNLNSTSALSSENSSAAIREEISSPEKIKQEPEVKNLENKEEIKSNLSKLKQEEIDEEELNRQAVLEILQDLNKEVKVEKSDLKIETAEANIVTGEKESTLEDYDKIPIEQFGLAMLRGMGWQPDKGIGKTPQLVTTVVPLSRPRGMGLGADKTIKKPAATACDAKGEKLKLEKGCFVKVNAGKLLGHYGVLRGFDENAGRVLVEMSLLNNVESFNEFIVDRVSKEEFDKNSKVINISKYQEYKNKNRDREDEESQGGKKKIDGLDERREVSSREKRRDRARSRSKDRSRSENKYDRREGERSRSKDRSRGSENKRDRRDRERDKSEERRSRHKKSKHHKKHRH